MKKYTDMYPYQDTDGTWCVVRVADGHRDVTPYTWKTKESAILYCEAHGFAVKEKSKHNLKAI